MSRASSFSRRPVARELVERPRGADPEKWNEAVHEGGHAVAAFLLEIPVAFVSLSLLHDPCTCTLTGPAHAPEALGVVGVAGAAAQRVAGHLSARVPPSDRAMFAREMGSASRMPAFLSAVEGLYRTAAFAPLLGSAARFLYRLHGHNVPGPILRKALPLRAEHTSAAVAVLESLRGPA